MEYRETGKTMKAWRRLSKAQQQVKIDACKTKTPSVASQNNDSSYSSALAARHASSLKVTPTPDHEEPVNRKRTRVTASTTPLESTATFTPSVGSAFRKRSKHEEMATTTAMAFENQRPLPQQQLLPSFDAIPQAGALVPTPVKAQRLRDCQGGSVKKNEDIFGVSASHRITFCACSMRSSGCFLWTQHCLLR
jgi:hypothetical protein